MDPNKQSYTKPREDDNSTPFAEVPDEKNAAEPLPEPEEEVTADDAVKGVLGFSPMTAMNSSILHTDFQTRIQSLLYEAIPFKGPNPENGSPVFEVASLSKLQELKLISEAFRNFAIGEDSMANRVNNALYTQDVARGMAPPMKTDPATDQ